MKPRFNTPYHPHDWRFPRVQTKPGEWQHTKPMRPIAHDLVALLAVVLFVLGCCML